MVDFSEGRQAVFDYAQTAWRGKHAWIRDPDGNRVELYEEVFQSKRNQER